MPTIVATQAVDAVGTAVDAPVNLRSTDEVRQLADDKTRVDHTC